ncbi:MAG: hypothetical protein IPM91_05460 [Bacteroidetes bacterium]|nr:hypothetical protein [Bacteroidota bacterium]
MKNKVYSVQVKSFIQLIVEKLAVFRFRLLWLRMNHLYMANTDLQNPSYF